MLRVQNVGVRFGGIVALDNVSFDVPSGAIVGLIGPNGAGKTTLFNCLSRLYECGSGEILFDGSSILKLPTHRIAEIGIGRTFQIPRPFAEMTVLENVLSGGQDQAGEHIWMNFLRPGRVAAQEKAAVERARGLLDFVTLSALEGQPARILSGGQRKLLELARILMADPRAILLDEPAAGVNPALLELIIDRVLDLNRRGKSILLIEHNMEMVSRLCGRVVVMAAGRHLTEGAPAEVARNPAVIEAYLGGVA